jgi:hypothetical protein
MACSALLLTAKIGRGAKRQGIAVSNALKVAGCENTSAILANRRPDDGRITGVDFDSSQKAGTET